MAKRIKGGYEPVKKQNPPCPSHGDMMMFVVDAGRWECSEPGCQQIAFPPRLISGSGKPIVGSGEIELVSVKESGTQTYYLRSIDNNIMLDVTSHVDDVKINSGDVKIKLSLFNSLEIHQ